MVTTVADPFAPTSDATAVRAISARLNGFATPNGLAAVAWFEWGDRGSFAWSTEPAAVGNSYAVTHTSQGLTDLTPQTTYQSRLAVSNACGVTRSPARIFSTGGRVAVWGYDYFHAMVLPAGLSNIVAVTAGVGFNVVARSEGTLFAWDLCYNGTTNVPPAR